MWSDWRTVHIRQHHRITQHISVMTHGCLCVTMPARARVWSLVDTHSCVKEGSCSALGGGQEGTPPRPPRILSSSTHPEDCVSGRRQRRQQQRAQHSRPMGQEQPSAGRNGGGRGRGSINPGRNLLGSPSLFSGKTGRSQP